MVFSSPLFLFLFLPILLILYFVIPNFLKNALLLTFSLVFYAWGELQYAWLILFSIAFNWLFALAIENKNFSLYKKLILYLAILLNIGLLIYYKYFNFFLASLGYDFEDSIPLPLGISFYTFHALSYVIDVYRGKSTAQKSLTNLGLYISNFAQLVAGPIVRYPDVVSQLTERSLTVNDFAYGIHRFIIGLSKKVLIANNVAIVVDQVFSLSPHDIDFKAAWLGIICYSLQLFFDFSGYSDMAIGLGRMFGFHFLENFNYPYISKSIREFWRRWHISLSNWFKDYLYIPLGGSKKGKARTYINLIIVFLLCGLWHGASWTFILWGLWHGAFLVIERAGWGSLLKKTPIILQHLYTMLIVTIGWVLFRSDSLSFTMSYIKAMFFINNATEIYLPVLEQKEIWIAFVAGIIASTTMPKWFLEKVNMVMQGSRSLHFPYSILKILLLFSVFFLAVISLSGSTYNPFIYFRF